MKLIDTHTHTLSDEPDVISIFNAGSSPTPARHFSVGIHPWYITADWQEEFLRVENLSTSQRCKAIGECGLDKLSTTPLSLQREVFVRHIQLSEERKLPLIIHCVKAFDELLCLKRQLRPSQTWIIHGFRGKPEQARQLLAKGFHLSFGEHYNEESLRLCPPDRLHFETDESERTIKEIYADATKYLDLRK